MLNFFKTVFNAIFLVIYVCNIIELIGYRLEQKGKKKEQIGLELIQLITVSVYTLYLITKGAF